MRTSCAYLSLIWSIVSALRTNWVTAALDLKCPLHIVSFYRLTPTDYTSLCLFSFQSLTCGMLQDLGDKEKGIRVWYHAKVVKWGSKGKVATKQPEQIMKLSSSVSEATWINGSKSPKDTPAEWVTEQDPPTRCQWETKKHIKVRTFAYKQQPKRRRWLYLRLTKQLSSTAPTWIWCALCSSLYSGKGKSVDNPTSRKTWGCG